ncbi:MAG TPA: hypothetical protein VHA73_09710 [Acidimicrobiales bacterium]|jgi:hypothetical protein|nr:hypothetical protein [Acidimicrobiales bacterium]
MGERSFDVTSDLVRPRRSAVALALALATVTVLAACSGSGDADARVVQGVRQPASGTIGCPITAAQVADVLGIQVDRDAASCSFHPADGALAPNATFNRELAVAFTQSGLSQGQYAEPVAGIGDQAYLTAPRPDGTRLLVRAGSLRFEIRVQHDAGGVQARRDALRLAQLVIEHG